ncbi:putative inactive leucine-rich repeat receptor-like protein kinase [Sesamum angolense]|uniref:Inactive leucine-rich repeat receptor-like protein kinase n=1 Tax=Sesamum angolense TaxID=2727404 RepID=A0AAE1XFL3_9LAMI|nr:putative inactive leucine-rich repeat receptor-like protein kinase [Sesamum angolense]
MAKPVVFTLNFLFLLVFLLPHCSNQLQPSQYEALVKIKQLLKFPDELSSWSENQDFCNSEPTRILTLACYEDNITQLHVTGTYWFPHLSQDFSTAALFSNIAALPYLKVLSLVSIGLKGPLPSGIGELSSLEILNISSNSFSGSIPREVSSMRNLQTLILDHNSFTALRALVLSGNNLSGQVPGLHNLTNLQVLDLENNNLGPQFPSLPTKLVSLVLRKNKFHSAVSDELSSCYQLKKLDISLNELVGLFSPSFLSLPSLTYLDIGGNKFTAKLSENISCNEQLSFVNLSENRLTGELPDCLQSSSRTRVVLYNGNCLSGRYQDQHPLSFCHSEALAVGISPNKEDEKRGYDKAVLASSMVGGIVGATALLGLAFLFVKREFAKQHRHVNKDPHTRLIVDKISPANTLQLLKDARYISETMKLGALGIPPYRTFVLDELKEATNNFNALNLIGEAGHYHVFVLEEITFTLTLVDLSSKSYTHFLPLRRVQVYKGWLIDGTVVAIRSMKVKKRHSIHTYTHQLELVAKLRHCHLVSAIGHCFECCQDDSSVRRIFLVFDSTDGQPGQKFTWKQRIGAAVGVARGIQFLHTGIVPGVYSNRLKITDVLLDHDLHVKISKYNLPLLAETRRLDEVEVSSRGPKQDFVLMLGCEEKDDVYDLGVILLEIIVGRTIISFSDISVSKDILSVSLTADSIARRSIVDPAIHKECSDDSLKTLIELCIRCLSTVPSERPSVEDVLWNLLFAAQVQEMWHREPSSNRDSPVHAPSVNLTV